MPIPTVVNSSVPKGKALPRFGGGSGGSGSGGPGGSSVSANLYGSGSPEGVKVGSPGYVYTDVDTGDFWNKVTGDGTTTGWNQLIG